MSEQFRDEGRLPAVHPAPHAPEYAGAVELDEDAMPMKVALVATQDAMDSSEATLVAGSGPEAIVPPPP
eukprot:11190038-Lingulodinium_polyedra.AAC.1